MIKRVESVCFMLIILSCITIVQTSISTGIKYGPDVFEINDINYYKVIPKNKFMLLKFCAPLW